MFSHASDARRRRLLCAGTNHAAVPHAGHVQTINGRAGSLHVPARKYRSGTNSRIASALPVPGILHLFSKNFSIHTIFPLFFFCIEFPNVNVRFQLVPHTVHDRPKSHPKLSDNGCVSVGGHGVHLQSRNRTVAYRQGHSIIAGYGSDAEGKSSERILVEQVELKFYFSCSISKRSCPKK